MTNSVTYGFEMLQNIVFELVTDQVRVPAGSLEALNHERFKAFFILQLNNQLHDFTEKHDYVECVPEQLINFIPGINQMFNCKYEI